MAQATPCAAEPIELDRAEIAALYIAPAATGTEAQPAVDLLTQYLNAISAGDSGALADIVSPDFMEGMGFENCELDDQSGPAADTISFTPMRVTIDENGTLLAFIQRAYDDGSDAGYQDVWMVIASPDDESDGDLRLDFAHRDIFLDDGSSSDAETIYLNGLEG